MPTTTQLGVDTSLPTILETDSDAADAFMSRWSDTDPEKVSKDPEDEDLTDADDDEQQQEANEPEQDEDETEADPEEESQETEDESEEESEEEEPKGKYLDDEAKVKLRVDDEELEVSVKDLKRLYGQEKALTKKSQAVAEQRKATEAANQRAAAQLDRLHKKASERWEPYSKIDMLVASKQLDAEQFAALRAEAQAAYDDYRFVTQEVDSFVKAANEQRQQDLQVQAKEAIKTLQDTVPNWSQALYDEICAYAVDKGMDANVVRSMVDPTALQLIHKAMQFDKAKTVTTKKVVQQPKKILKTTKAVTANDAKVDKTSKAKQRLKASGTTEDAADLFMARWAAD